VDLPDPADAPREEGLEKRRQVSGMPQKGVQFKIAFP